MDAQAASELRQAKHAAAKVLREHGVNAQVVVDANQPRSPLPGVPSDSSSGGESPPAPGFSLPGPEAAAQRHTSRRTGVPRLPGEDAYMQLRVKRFFGRVGRKGQR
jgi:hypothetical protein